MLKPPFRKDEDFWSEKDCENIDSCPVCAEKQRDLLHAHVRDYLFSTPGNWRMYSCSGCGSAYLDPRPGPASIGRAYTKYLTHELNDDTKAKRPGLLKWIKRAIERAYRNKRYTNRTGFSRLASWAIYLLPARRRKIDVEMRYMPKPSIHSRLLDLGCGNGDFLLRAQQAGWRTVGVDFDPKAAALARQRGLDIRVGDINILVNEPAFDGITLSHTIEHVHDPVAVITACYRLLKPGGWLWLETPNIDSQGHQLYGEYWRGLEAPRHLVLFNHNSLRSLLSTTGFEHIELLPYRPVCRGIFGQSAAFAKLAQRDSITNHAPPESLAKMAEKKARAHPDIREFISMRAWKPSS